MSSNIDHIFYINLDYRTDRREQIERELNNFELSFERVSAIKADPGLLGCGLSHLKALQLAKQRGYKNVLILEDDFTFLVSKKTFEEQLRLFFDSNVDYDVCMISYNLVKSTDCKYSFLYKSLEVQTASGYLVNSDYYDILIHNLETGMKLFQETKEHWIYCNDQYWKRLQPIGNWYCFKVRMGKQRGSYSDNFHHFTDYNC